MEHVVNLETLDEVEKRIEMFELNRYIIYGSPCRPMSATWAPIPDAVFIAADKEKTEYHTYIAVPVKLSREEINRYELVLVSRPMSDEERESRQEAWDKHMADFVSRIPAEGYSDEQIMAMFWGNASMPIQAEQENLWEE